MNKAFLLLCLAFIPSILTSPPYNTDNGRRTAPIFPRALKSYDIDLDASYENQWKSIIPDFEPSIVNFIKGLGVKAKLALQILDLIDYPIVAAYDKKFALEIYSLANLIKISFTEAFFLNLLYDITAQCTSIVIQDSQGNIYHGRNLDFPFAPELSTMMFHGRYFRKGKLIYEAIGLAGYTGLITGMKPGAYSFSIDQYVLYKNATIESQIVNAALDIAQAFQKKLSPPLVARKAFETMDTYDELVEYLKTTSTMSRVFYIVAGTQPGQGAAITRFRNSVENVTSLDSGDDEWYVVQTNYIGDVPDPLFDNRATAARDWLNSIGENAITKEMLLNEVMAVYPVFNNETIHTTIMQPSIGYINTTLWGW